MKLSLIIPAYNEEKLIGACLEAVFKQEVPADEVIVVNNNSTDKTVEIVKKFPVKLVHEKKQGMTPTRNKGFNSAQFEIIGRIDADVILKPDWVKKIKQNFKNKKIDAISGPISYYVSSSVASSPLPTQIYLKVLKMLSKGHGFLIGPNMAISNEIWKKVKKRVNNNDLKVHEDIDLSLKINKVGGVIGYDKNLIVRSSARRIAGNPQSFFVEYPRRLVRTFLLDFLRNKKLESDPAYLKFFQNIFDKPAEK